MVRRRLAFLLVWCSVCFVFGKCDTVPNHLEINFLNDSIELSDASIEIAYGEIAAVDNTGTSSDGKTVTEPAVTLKSSSVADVEGSEEPSISAIRVYVDGSLAWTTSYNLENVIQPNPTQQYTPDTELEKAWSNNMDRPEELRRREDGEEFDWRLHYESGSSNESTPSVEHTSDLRSSPTLLHNGSHGAQVQPSGSIEAEKYEKSGGPVIEWEPVGSGEPYETTQHNTQLGGSDSSGGSSLFLFTYLAHFLSLIQPYDFPVEFVRDALWNRVSVVNLIFQSLRFEAGFVICVSLGLLLSLVVPAFAVASACSSICVPDASKLSDSASTLSSQSVKCSRKAYVCALVLLVFLLGTGVVALLVTNEQLSSALLRSPQVLSSSLNDAGTYIRNTHRQITHVTMSAFDTTLTYLHNDLHEVEELLGKPIQNQVAAETGVDVALDALVDVTIVSDDLSQKVAELQDGNLKMRGMLGETRDRLADLRAQVDSLRRACPSRDRPLCDTIDSTGLEITLRTEQINTDPRLALLRAMSAGELSTLAKRVKNKFSEIPVDVSRATTNIREGIKAELDLQRRSLDIALWPVDNLARDLRSRVNEARGMAESVEDVVNNIEQWRWLSLLLTAFLVLVIWIVLVVAIGNICCDKAGTARALLITSLVLSSILSLLLWAVALCIMLLGGHGEVFVCRPLYDQPQYKSLTELLDDPGVLMQRSGGFFRNLVPRNYTLQVPVRNVLQDCEKNNPAYDAFQLQAIFSADSAADFKTWGNVLNFINNLNGNFTQLNFLDSELQEKLQSLLQATAVNMTSLRSHVSRPLTGRDLQSFAQQLDSVAHQIKDLTTAARVETLASRIRRLITTNIQPLEEKKEELVYQVTALEVLIAPLQRQVNQSLSHLKTIQYYIDNQGVNISQMKASDYSKRLVGYLTQYREQLLNQLQHTVGLCRPVFELYHGVRHHVCRQIMDPLNGYWFAMVVCLMALVFATPVCIRLIHYYGLQKDALLDNSGSLNCGERAPVWSTPGNDVHNSPNW